MAFVEACAAFQKVLEDGTPFPLIFTPLDPENKEAAALAREVAKRGEWLDSKLANSGAILFRGFQVTTPEEFNTFVEALGWEEFPYIEAGGAAKRTRVVGKVLTVNDLPLEQKLGFHNEAYYLAEFPSRVMFFCEDPPPRGTGGETSIVHGSTVCKRVLQDCKGFADKASSIGYVSKRNPTSDAFQMLRKPFREDRAGRLSWFNSVGFYAANLREERDIDMVLGDGTEVATSDDLDAVVRVLEEEKVALQWEKGDILMVDNTAVQHARESCTSSERRILISLSK